MGIEHEPEYCYITSQKTHPIKSGGGTKSYSVSFGGKTWEFRFFRYYEDTPYINDNKHILKGLLLNNKWPLKRLDVIKTEVLETIIRTGFYPKTPSEKLNNLLLFLYEIQENIGEIIDIDSKISHDILIPKLYFKSHNEYYFYLETLKDQGLIEGMDATSKQGSDLVGIKITYQGFQKIIQIQEEGKTSNNCFVAMSFSDDVRDIRDVCVVS